MIKSTGIAAVVLLAAVSCIPAQDFALPESGAWDAAVEAGTRTVSGTPGEKYWTDRVAYHITAELDAARARVTGKAVMTYENRSPGALRTLLIHLRRNIHAKGAVRNMPVEVTGGVELARVALNGAELASGRGAGHYAVRGTVMTVFLRQGQGDPGEELTVEIDWSHVVPPAGGAPRTGHEQNHTFFLGYWYPQFAVHDDVEGWVADPYMGMGEFYMPYGDYEVELTVPHGFIVRTTGVLRNPEEVYSEQTLKRLESARTSDDVVHVVEEDDREAGTSTAFDDSGKLTWKFTASGVRDFAVSVSDLYVWDATHADVSDDETCEIHAVYEPEVHAWREAATYAKHLIGFMSRHVGRYPFPHATVCEGVCGGGMEFPMMTAIGVTRNARGVQSVIAHELIHMWFPMTVGSNEKRYSWMDEGTTSFLTTLACADYWGSTTPHASPFRSYVRFGSRFSVPPMTPADGTTAADMGAQGFATYQKTSAILHQLRFMLGADTFDAALRTYFERWSFKHPRPRDFFNVMSEAAGKDLAWYFRCWMYESWRLDFAVSYAEAGGEGTITVTRNGKAVGPVEIEVDRGDEKATLAIPVEKWLDGAAAVELTVAPGVTRVALDPRDETLDVRPSNNSWEK